MFRCLVGFETSAVTNREMTLFNALIGSALFFSEHVS